MDATTSDFRHKTRASEAFLPIIDALRALAVTVVVAYHAGLPYVPGGFVGVDVFFVISGFLIIGHIVTETRRGVFTFAGFYARRAVRILPPYFLVIAVSSVIAWYVLALPSEIADFGQQALWSALMLANHFFLSQQGYFDTAAELKPLLHLWSLGVEEQFYVVAPLLIYGMWRLYRKAGSPALVIGATALIFVVSLALCIILTPADDGQNWAFYLMPLRAWEFIAGGALGFAMPHARRLPAWVGTTAVVAGFAMVLSAVATYDHGDVFPGHLAILPVLGTCLVILGGVAHPRTLVVRVTTVPPVLWIGLVSYSWYLWHWPLLAFARIYNFGERDLALDLSMAALSLALAAQTYIWLERPLLAWRKGHGATMASWRPTMVGFGVSAHVVLAGFFLSAVAAPRAELAIAPGMMPDPPSVGVGRCRLELMTSAGPCLAQIGDRRAGLVFGDSHSITALPVLRSVARDNGVDLTAIMPSSCPAMIDTRTYTRTGNEFARCGSAISEGYSWISKGDIAPDFAILHARWVTYTPWTGRPAGNGTKFELGRFDEKGPAKDQHALFVAQLRHTIEELAGHGVKRFLVIGPVPELYRSAPECVIRADKAGIRREAACSMPRKAVDARRRQTVSWLAEAVKGLPGVRLIDPVDALCDSERCDPFKSDYLLYRDTNHLSNSGFRTVVNAFEKDFDWVMSGKG